MNSSLVRPASQNEIELKSSRNPTKGIIMERVRACSVEVISSGRAADSCLRRAGHHHRAQRRIRRTPSPGWGSDRPAMHTIMVRSYTIPLIMVTLRGADAWRLDQPIRNLINYLATTPIVHPCPATQHPHHPLQHRWIRHHPRERL